MSDRLRRLAELAEAQLFFVGGAPRSGTTWLQEILNAHPDISCRGEGLFPQHLAKPIDDLVGARGAAISAKNQTIFGHGPGYPVPDADDADTLVATGILLALQRQVSQWQAEGRAIKAVGEKTPENAFFLGRLHRLFPHAKFIVIARDPRDVIASAWHFFPRAKPADAGEDAAMKLDFIRLALPSLIAGLRAVVEFGRDHSDDLLVVTYEALKATPNEAVARLFAFLAVAADETLVERCVARTSFEAMTQGRSAGVTVDGSFFRSGVAGGWRRTLTPEMGELIMRDLTWAAATFGWMA